MTVETERFTQEMHSKVVALDGIRRTWAGATEDERRYAFDLFVDIEDCYRNDWQAIANFQKYLMHQPITPWRRATKKEATS
jgi:hypothetical protein